MNICVVCSAYECNVYTCVCEYASTCVCLYVGSEVDIGCLYQFLSNLFFNTRLFIEPGAHKLSYAD